MESTRMSPRLLAVLVVGALACIALLAGCSDAPQPVVRDSVAAPVKPPPADLTVPASAVRSYLDWTAYAYRIAVSDAASHTMTPEESVRVDSYLQLNLQEKGRRIDQHLVRFAAREPSVEGTRAVVGATEKWEYRYLSADGERALTPTYTASYETTYTLIRADENTWLVDSVEAEALGEVK